MKITREENEVREKEIKFSELGYNEFINLVNFLKLNSKKELESEKELDALEQLEYFFPNMNAEAETLIKGLGMSILENRFSEGEFESVKKIFPDQIFNREGNSNKKPKTQDGMRLAALDELFEKAKSDLEKEDFNDTSRNKVNTQIYNAKTLKFFEDKKAKIAYRINEMLFVKKYGRRISPMELNNFKSYLKFTIHREDPLNIIMETALQKKMAVNDFYFFFNHLVARTEIAFKESLINPDNMSESSAEFLKRLKELFPSEQ